MKGLGYLSFIFGYRTLNLEEVKRSLVGRNSLFRLLWYCIMNIDRATAELLIGAFDVCYSEGIDGVTVSKSTLEERNKRKEEILFNIKQMFPDLADDYGHLYD